jgi:hypothetical protein
MDPLTGPQDGCQLLVEFTRRPLIVLGGDRRQFLHTNRVGFPAQYSKGHSLFAWSSRIARLFAFLFFVVPPAAMAWWQDTQTSRLDAMQRQEIGKEAVSESTLRERAGLLRHLMRDDPRHASEFLLSDARHRELLSRFPQAANWLESAGEWQGELFSIGEGVQPAQARPYDASGLLLDTEGNQFFAEGGADGPHRIRKVSFAPALDRSDMSFLAAGGSGSVRAAAPSSAYPWSVSGNAPWLHAAQNRFKGNGTVSFTVGANASSQACAGLLTIGDRFLLVRQDAAGIVPLRQVQEPVRSLIHPPGV